MKNTSVTKELSIDCLEGLSVSYELSNQLKWAIDNRRKTHKQEDISRLTGKSISSIKRFEQGKVDSLFLFAFYIEYFSD